MVEHTRQDQSTQVKKECHHQENSMQN